MVSILREKYPANGSKCIAEVLGVSRKAVKNKAQTLGIKVLPGVKNRGNKLSLETKAKISATQKGRAISATQIERLRSLARRPKTIKQIEAARRNAVKAHAANLGKTLTPDEKRVNSVAQILSYRRRARRRWKEEIVAFEEWSQQQTKELET